jgi:hypothetical protein
MNSGANVHVDHGGADYHIQIEQLSETLHLDVRVYTGGRILFHKKISYAESVEGLVNPVHVQSAVQEEVAKLLALVKGAILKGRIKAE